MSEARRVQLYFDFGSPYAYLLAERLEGFRQRVSVTLEWVPVSLRTLMDLANAPPYERNRLRYTMADVPRSAEMHGLPLRAPSKWPVDSQRALEVFAAARALPESPVFARSVLRAAWAEDRDISEPSVLASCLTAAGLDPAAFLPAAGSAAAGELVARLSSEAHALGVFGVPTLALGSELFWGNDRLPMLEWRLTGRAGPAA